MNVFFHDSLHDMGYDYDRIFAGDDDVGVIGHESSGHGFGNESDKLAIYYGHVEEKGYNDVALERENDVSWAKANVGETHRAYL